MASPERITEEQATEALRQLVADQQASRTEPETPEAPQPVAEAAPVEAEQPVAEEAPEAADDAPAEAAAASTEEAPSDDVQSLRLRLKEAEDAHAREAALHKARWDAMVARNAENARIQHDKYIRKASVTDRALRTLKAVRVGDGLTEAEVDRVIQEVEGTMNPASASYAPAPQPSAPAEDLIVVRNDFLNEVGMTDAEASEFGKWITLEAPSKMTLGEQATAAESPRAFLHLAHSRYQQDIANKSNQRAQAQQAVQAVQRTQKQAAKASVATPAAPRKPPVSGTPKGYVKMDDLKKGDALSRLFRQSIEQNR